jgi:hypothetical protein
MVTHGFSFFDADQRRMAGFNTAVAERPGSKLSECLRYLFLGTDAHVDLHVGALVTGSLLASHAVVKVKRSQRIRSLESVQKLKLMLL